MFLNTNNINVSDGPHWESTKVCISMTFFRRWADQAQITYAPGKEFPTQPPFPHPRPYKPPLPPHKPPHCYPTLLPPHPYPPISRAGPLRAIQWFKSTILQIKPKSIFYCIFQHFDLRQHLRKKKKISFSSYSFQETTWPHYIKQVQQPDRTQWSVSCSRELKSEVLKHVVWLPRVHVRAGKQYEETRAGARDIQHLWWW